jgi:sulfur carrier protein ThiS
LGDNQLIKVSVILHSYLRELLPPETGGRTILELQDEQDVASVIKLLNVPPAAVAALNGSIVRDHTTVLHDGDELRFLRPGAGG